MDIVGFRYFRFYLHILVSILVAFSSSRLSAASLRTVDLAGRWRHPALLVALGLGFGLWMAVLLWQSLSVSAGGEYWLTGHFSHAGGVKPGNVVSFGGVNVGEVTHVALDRQNLEAVVTVNITAPGVRIPIDSIIAIQTLDVLGRRGLRIIPGYDEQTLQSGEAFALAQEASDIIGLLKTALN